jgi:hypothetical protein
LCRINNVHPPIGYVNLLQNPTSFPILQPIPSRPEIPYNYNFVGTSSHPTPLAETQPPHDTPLAETQTSATKKSKQGALNKHAHSRSINLEDADDGEPSNRNRMTWTTKEDERLVSF